MRYADKIPYVFILDHLNGVDIVIKPMFGCYSIYAHGKLCLILMHREKPLKRGEETILENGAYLTTTAKHSESLRRDFPNADFRSLKDGKIWIYFPERSELFEEYVIAACEMIRRDDARVGR